MNSRTYHCQISVPEMDHLYCANNSPRLSVLACCELSGPKTHDHDPVVALSPLAKEPAQIAFLRGTGIVELVFGSRTRAWDLGPDFAFFPTDAKTFCWTVALTYRVKALTCGQAGNIKRQHGSHE